MIHYSHSLQAILGVDKRNPVFSVYKDAENNILHVYFSALILETIPDDREHVQYKLMVARLYNAKLKTTVLHQVFGIDPKTMKRWGDALKKGDHDELSRVLAGRSSRKKSTPSIQS